MESIVSEIKAAAIDGLKAIQPNELIRPEDISINEVGPEFEGDFSVVLFPFLKRFKMRPEALGEALGLRLTEQLHYINGFSVVKGFLNLTIGDDRLFTFLKDENEHRTLGHKAVFDKKVMIEYASPNTNKPLHFGHLRNIFLGWSTAEILKDQGFEVIKANLVNDRGIHICKSMVAWMRYGNGATPESTGIKGDHLVGDYYVKFNDAYKTEVKQLVDKGLPPKDAEKQAPIFLEAQDLLRRWEDNDAEVRKLWATMNGWVLKGFDETFDKLSVDFDKIYYESNTYLLGKEMVENGLEKGVLFKKEDGSVWVDLTSDGLDEKLLLRADGTSVYMTQDLGTAHLRYEDFKMDKSIYVIGDEQNYHMKVLKLILQKLGEPCADGIFHLAYGMVELPTGRMKSREGTVVDADDMIKEMVAIAQQQTEDSGKTEDFDDAQLKRLYAQIGLGALKFYLLRVDPKKKMIFNPKESIDLHGFTATFVQYAYARIHSIFRKADIRQMVDGIELQTLLPLEKKLLLKLESFPSVLEQAARDYNPALVCSYAFQLAQVFNGFFDRHSVIHAETEAKKELRLQISELTRLTLEKSLRLLGISAPERM